MKTLYLYQKQDFYALRKQIEEQGYILDSITAFLKSDVIQAMDSDIKHFVDITILASLFKSTDGVGFQFEQLMPCFNDNVDFITEKSKGDELQYEFRYFFDGTEDLEVSHGEQNRESNETITIEQSQDVKKIIDLSDEEVESFFGSFNSKLYGHERFKEEFKDIVNSFRVFNSIGEHKVLSLFLMGDSGVGKTEVARVIHKCLFSKKKIAKINFGNYSSHDALNSLIGSPLGYIGSDGGELMKRVLDSDVGLILIDEFEKANTAVFNYFLDVLENGKIVNTQADEYDVNGYIIVFTSNITSDDYKKYISPELSSRFDYKGVFNLLTDEDKTKFLFFRINDIINKYEKSQNINVEKNLYSKIVSEIDVSKYKNMRDLNKKIKDTFVKAIKEKVVL